MLRNLLLYDINTTMPSESNCIEYSCDTNICTRLHATDRCDETD